MNQISLFPHFKPLEIGDRETIHSILWQYQPETSELTFSNLYMWRKKYHYRWAIFENWLFLIATDENGKIYALEPIGPPSREKAVLQLLDYLSRQPSGKPEIDRADKRIVNELQSEVRFLTEPVRKHFDYLYCTSNMVNLSGRKFHSKRNHLNRFLLSYRFDYQELTDAHISQCMEFSARWCRIYHCKENPSLCEESVAINEALAQFNRLHLSGGAIYIDGKMEAFTLGELLNDNTAVIHVEKASPEFHGIYAAINQMFCASSFKNTTFINREQDLGNKGLRKAKLSYHPVRFVEKFRIEL